MAIQTIFFDLDGTLLPMDQDRFVQEYTNRLAAYMAPHGYSPELLIKALWTGTGAMVKNTGEKHNEAVFWDVFCRIVGKDARADLPLFDQFYQTDFQSIQGLCGFAPEAATVVHSLQKRGFGVILATNPLFPAVATHSRIRWAGLTPEDFDFCTTYENSSFCKPNPAYYQDLLETFALRAEECAMVGNDADEDMIAETLGMQTFLLTDCLINRNNVSIDRWPHGSFDALQHWLDSLSV